MSHCRYNFLQYCCRTSESHSRPLSSGILCTHSAIYGIMCIFNHYLVGLFCMIWQVITPVDLILRLYATGLYLTNYEVKFRGGDLTSSRAAKDEFTISCLLDDGDQLHNLASLLGALGSYFSFCCTKNFVSSSVECEDSVSRIYLQPDSESSITYMEKNRKAYMLSYLNALKFLCLPLAEKVNLEKKEIVSEIEAASISPQICSIQDAFFQFFYVFFSQRQVNQNSQVFTCLL